MGLVQLNHRPDPTPPDVLRIHHVMVLIVWSGDLLGDHGTMFAQGRLALKKGERKGTKTTISILSSSIHVGKLKFVLDCFSIFIRYLKFQV